jgi:predicted anti-sigma-YlaC factor YlaD
VNNRKQSWAWTAVVLCLALFVSSGCSVREYALRSVGDALANGGDAYGSDDDIELIGAATPFGLKTIESLLAEIPDHRGLLLAAARGFTQYAYVYVQLPADEAEERDVAYAYAQRERARRLYQRALSYGLRGLGLQEKNARDQLQSEPEKALAGTSREDVALLYWTGLAWAAAISLSKDSPATIAGLPAADALIRRASALDVDFDHGALRTFLIGYEMSRPNAGPDAEKRARAHFARAVELSQGRQAGPYVSLAEAVSVEKRDRREFEALLKRAIQVDAGARPEWRLANLVMQKRARRLLAHVDELFPE